MKPRLILIGCLAVMTGFVFIITTVVAQQVAVSASSTTLKQAATLMAQGDFPAARKLISSITNTTDSNYGPAKCYDALCLYKQGDKKAFLKEMNTPAVQNANLDSAVREDLEIKQIDALFYYRNFDELTSKTQRFQTNHPASTRLPVLAEYQMAGLFEYGMKKTYEACALKDISEYNQHWNIGRDNLEKFVASASKFTGTNYQTISDRVLREEIWTARMTLGDEAGLLAEMPVQAAADRERIAFLGIRLFQRLQPAEVDKNLQRMAKFISEFPESKNRKRVEFEMANISFSKGEALIREADAIAKTGEADIAAQKRAQAQGYFNYTRSLQDQFIADPAAGIEESDVLDRQDDLLNSYYLERNYDQMLSLANGMIQASAPGELRWMMGNDYAAIALLSRSPNNFNQAAARLDDVLALNFNGRADHDHHVLVAAKWRIYIAQRNADDAKATQLVQWVRDSKCVKNQKAAFLKIYPDATGSK